MAPFPLPLGELLGHYGQYVVYLLIGFAFGYVLEIAGFGNSRKLAAQFYFKDLTVLKVMFGAIITAMVLIFAATSLGLLDFNLIWVNPTYLWSGIVGGLIMGVGFIVGGFCPGTSLVAMATGKLDGIFFVLGVFFGIFLFGETVDGFAEFWNGSYLGRFTLPELFGIPVGWVVLGVVLMALFMFWGAEQLEKRFGPADAPPAPRKRYYAAAALLLGALAVLVMGQPTTAERWANIATESEAKLANREVQIHPGELLTSLHDNALSVIMLDVRAETDYNLFHIRDAVHAPLETLPERIEALQMEPANTLIVVMGNDEKAATEAWKLLMAEAVPNVYILEGGINYWLATFGPDSLVVQSDEGIPAGIEGTDTLKFVFPAAIGSRHVAATPDIHQFELEYTPKVQMELKRGPTSGGCG